MRTSEQTIVTIATACPCTPVTVTFVGDPNALLEEVLASYLGSGGQYFDHLCQFCGCGHNEPFSDKSEHKPDCLWLRIKEHLQAAGRLKADPIEEAVRGTH